MPKSDKSIFANASALRDSITKEQEKNITKLYEGWSKDIQEKAKYYERLTTNSSSLMTSYYNQLYNQVKTTGKEVANGVYTNITNGMLEVSDAVVKDTVEWTKGLGFDEKTVSQALSSVPASIVNAISTGSVYGKPGSWSLSKSIWGDSEKILRDIYTIVAGGAAMQQSIAEIADQLSKYVNPTKELLWSGPKGMKIYRRKVDYSSQRLARTLMQHTYQQSFVATTQDNPFITAYRWNSNGSRICDICKRRDGKIFQKNQLPLDHPNGMCTMEPVVMDQEERLDRLADWVMNDDGKYPEIDEFARRLGFTGSKKMNNVSNSTFVSNTTINVSRKNYFNEYDDMDKLRNLLMESGKFNFSQILAIGDDINALRKAADSIYEDAWNSANAFRKKYSLTGSAEEITNYLRQINLDDLPSTMNNASVYQRYSLIKNSSDMPEIVDDLSGDGIQIFRSVKSANGLSASIINEMTKYDKDTFIGSGVFGDGIYFSSSKVGAGVYGAEEVGSVIYAEIKDTAKIIDYDLLTKMKKEAGQSNADDAIFAAEHGFDVISKRVDRNEEGEVYYCVLKRSALKIKR